MSAPGAKLALSLLAVTSHTEKGREGRMKSKEEAAARLEGK